MSFKQCSVLPHKFLSLESKIKRVCNALVRLLPEQKVFPQVTLLQIIRQHVSSQEEEVFSALQEIGVVTRRAHKICRNCTFPEEQCTCSTPSTVEEVVFEVTGEVMALINNLENALPAALPYFISFYSGESLNDAQALHDALGGVGFLSSSELHSGDEWRARIADSLRECKTFFMMETRLYHERGVCAIERDYAAAVGCRIFRVGLTSRSELRHVPTWLNQRLQYETYIDATEKFDLSKLLASQHLPNPILLPTRKEAARTLIEKMRVTYIDKLADQLGGQGSMPSSGSKDEKELALVNYAFLDSVTADSFCAYLDFTELRLS